MEGMPINWVSQTCWIMTDELDYSRRSGDDRAAPKVQADDRTRMSATCIQTVRLHQVHAAPGARGSQASSPNTSGPRDHPRGEWP